MIEQIREIAKNCPAVKMHDNWNRLCALETYIEVEPEVCTACQDFTLKEHCICKEGEKK